MDNAATRSTAAEPLIGRRWMVATVRGTSMLPAFPPGSQVVVDTACPAPVRRGEVVAFRSHDRWVIHRVVAARPHDGAVRTQGDNRPTADPWLAKENIAGRAVLVRCSAGNWHASAAQVPGRFGRSRWGWLARQGLRRLCRWNAKEGGMAERFEVQELGRELLVHDRSTGEVHMLNETARLVWELLTQGKSVDEAVATLRAKYPEVGTSTLREDVLQIAASLSDKGLVQNQKEGRA